MFQLLKPQSCILFLKCDIPSLDLSPGLYKSCYMWQRPWILPKRIRSPTGLYSVRVAPSLCFYIVSCILLLSLFHFFVFLSRICQFSMLYVVYGTNVFCLFYFLLNANIGSLWSTCEFDSFRFVRFSCIRIMSLKCTSEDQTVIRHGK